MAIILYFFSSLVPTHFYDHIVDILSNRNIMGGTVIVRKIEEFSLKIKRYISEFVLRYITYFIPTKNKFHKLPIIVSYCLNLIQRLMGNSLRLLIHIYHNIIISW